VFNKVEKKSKRKESHHHFNEEAKCVRCGITISEVQSVFCREKNMLNDYLEAGGDEDCNSNRDSNYSLSVGSLYNP